MKNLTITATTTNPYQKEFLNSNSGKEVSNLRLNIFEGELRARIYFPMAQSNGYFDDDELILSPSKVTYLAMETKSGSQYCIRCNAAGQYTFGSFMEAGRVIKSVHCVREAIRDITTNPVDVKSEDIDNCRLFVEFADNDATQGRFLTTSAISRRWFETKNNSVYSIN